MGRDQELKWLAFSLYPLSFFLYSPFIFCVKPYVCQNLMNLSCVLSPPKTGFNWARQLKSLNIEYNIKWNHPLFDQSLKFKPCLKFMPCFKFKPRFFCKFGLRSIIIKKHDQQQPMYSVTDKGWYFSDDCTDFIPFSFYCFIPFNYLLLLLYKPINTIFNTENSLSDLGFVIFEQLLVVFTVSSFVGIPVLGQGLKGL